MKKALKKAMVGVALCLGLAGAAQAIAPLWFALGASSLIHLFGITYDYFVTSAKDTSGNTIKVVTPASINVTLDQAVSDQKRLPASSLSPTLVGPHYFKFTQSYNLTTPKSYTASGTTIAELMQSMAMCPSDVCDPGTPGTGLFTYTAGYDCSYSTCGQYMRRLSYAVRNQATASSIQGPVSVFNSSNGKVYQEITITHAVSGGTSTAKIQVEALPICKDGYAFNASSGICDVKDLYKASMSAGDGVCPTFAGYSIESDPDCKALKEQGRLVQQQDGTISVTTPDNTIVSTKQEADKTVVSQVFQSSDGGKRREDTYVSPQGVVNVTNVYNYPQNPPPLYPGDPGGSTVPSNSTTGSGTSAISCGGPNQPKCGFDTSSLESSIGNMSSRVGSSVDSLGSSLGSKIGQTNSTLDKIASGQCGGPGQDPCKVTLGDGEGNGPLDGVPSDPDGFGLDTLKQSASGMPVSASCPRDLFSFRMPLPASVGGPILLSDDGLACDTLDSYAELIRMVSIAAGLIAATFIVLRA